MKLLKGGKECLLKRGVGRGKALQNLSMQIQYYMKMRQSCIQALATTTLTHIMLLHGFKGCVEIFKPRDAIFGVGCHTCEQLALTANLA